jgi:hypothetical protein
MEEVAVVEVGSVTSGGVVMVAVVTGGGLTGGGTAVVEGFGFAGVAGGFGFGFVVGSTGSGIATARFSRCRVLSLLWLFLKEPMSLARATIVMQLLMQVASDER